MALRTRTLAFLGSLWLGCSGQVIDGNPTESTVDPSTPDAGPDDSLEDGQDDGAPRDGRDDERDAGEDLPGDGEPGDGAGDGEPEEPDPNDPCRNGQEPLAPGVRIRELALYQTVKIPLVQDGTWLASRTAPVVQGKAALVRVFVEPRSDASGRTVRGVLTLERAGEAKQLTTTLRPTGPSTDADRGSTFNFDVPAEDLGPDTRLSIALLDEACPSAPGSAMDARFPQAGLVALDAARVGPLNVVVVPVIVGGRAPDTSSAQLEAMRSLLLAYYPVPAVNLRVREAITSSARVDAGGGGWSDVLNEVLTTRQADRAASDVYYYGVIAPGSSFSAYCQRGCVLGLAPLTSRVSPSQQGGLGVGFLNEFTPDTMVHELGHAHGRSHAPCAEGGSISGVDGRFPYSGGSIGVWGYDGRDGSLVQPTTKDIMGYCSPTWISDYTYGALAARCMQVNAAARVSLPLGPRWRGILLYADGSSRMTAQAPHEQPAGELEVAEARDASGRVVARPEVVRVPLSHVSDAFLYIPEPAESWHELVLHDRTVRMDQVHALP